MGKTEPGFRVKVRCESPLPRISHQLTNKGVKNSIFLVVTATPVTLLRESQTFVRYVLFQGLKAETRQ